MHLDPQRCKFSDRRELSRLEVRESKGRKCSVLCRECSQTRYKHCKGLEEICESSAEEYKIGIAGLHG